MRKFPAILFVLLVSAMPVIADENVFDTERLGFHVKRVCVEGWQYLLVEKDLELSGEYHCVSGTKRLRLDGRTLWQFLPDLDDDGKQMSCEKRKPKFFGKRE